MHVQSSPQTNQTSDDSTICELNNSAVNSNNPSINENNSSKVTNSGVQSPQQHPMIGHSPQQSPLHHSPHNPMSRAIMLEGDFEFLRYLSVDELRSRMANLDIEMEAEIEELRRRYAAKRQPILDAMDNKKKRQQNF